MVSVQDGSAVNVIDLVALTEPGEARHPALHMLVRVLDREAPLVDAEPGQIDGSAMLVQADLPAEQWAAIVALVRGGIGRWPAIAPHRLRIYKGHGRTWKRAYKS